jgi:hypothetical protein
MANCLRLVVLLLQSVRGSVKTAAVYSMMVRAETVQTDHSMSRAPLWAGRDEGPKPKGPCGVDRPCQRPLARIALAAILTPVRHKTSTTMPTPLPCAWWRHLAGCRPLDSVRSIFLPLRVPSHLFLRLYHPAIRLTRSLRRFESGGLCEIANAKFAACAAG